MPHKRPVEISFARIHVTRLALPMVARNTLDHKVADPEILWDSDSDACRMNLEAQFAVEIRQLKVCSNDPYI